MKILFYLFSLFSVFNDSLYPEAAVQQNQELTSVAQDALIWAKAHLSKQGVLMQDRAGFVYLKVDDGYVDDLYPKFVPYGYGKPLSKKIGHISVMYPFETKKIEKIEELGNTYSFTLKSFDIVKLKRRNFIILVIEATDLEKLREKYGLGPLLLGHPFHISIAEQKHAVSFLLQKIQYQYVVNY